MVAVVRAGSVPQHRVAAPGRHRPDRLPGLEALQGRVHGGKQRCGHGLGARCTSRCTRCHCARSGVPVSVVSSRVWCPREHLGTQRAVSPHLGSGTRGIRVLPRGGQGSAHTPAWLQQREGAVGARVGLGGAGTAWSPPTQAPGAVATPNPRPRIRRAPAPTLSPPLPPWPLSAHPGPITTPVTSMRCFSSPALPLLNPASVPPRPPRRTMGRGLGQPPARILPVSPARVPCPRPHPHPLPILTPRRRAESGPPTPKKCPVPTLGSIFWEKSARGQEMGQEEQSGCPSTGVFTLGGGVPAPVPAPQ